MENTEVVKVLSNIADILELQGIKFKPNAYRRAAQSIQNLGEDLAEVHHRGELEKIPGIGKHIAAKIVELLEKNKSQYYENLKKEIDIDIEGLNEVPALGPKKIKVLYETLGIKNVKDLQKAIDKKQIQELPGFGKKSQQQLAQGILAAKDNVKRRSYKEIEPVVKSLLAYMKKCKDIEKIEVAGSFRRKKDTVRDIDLLVIAKQNDNVMEHFVKFKDQTTILARGQTKSAIRLKQGIQVDLRVVKRQEFGAALLYFTGSKEHNVELRRIALKQGMTLNEYGLYTLKDKKLVAQKTEKDVYGALGLMLIPPKERLNRGEFTKYKK